MPPLNWLPKSVADTTESWGWTSTVQSALGSLKEQGEQILQPIGQQIASAMPTPPPMPMPEVKLPEIQPFALPSMDAWGFGQPAAAPAQPAPQQDQGFSLSPATTPDATVSRGRPAATGGFELPGPEAWGMASTPRPASSQSPTATGNGMAGSSPVAPQRPGSGGNGTGPAPAAAPTGKIDNSSTEAFIRTAYPAFLAAAGGNKDLAEMMLAKATSENGNIGKGGDLMGFNFSGIKGKGPTGKSQRLATHEIINGARVDMDDDFAVYDTPQEGANAFMNFLQDNPRYHKALAEFRQSGDTQRLFRAVNDAGYATDAGWAEKVASRRANLVAPITRELPTQPTQPAGAPSPGTQRGGLDVGGITKAYEGIPYTFGGPGGRGQGLGTTTDCSGFVAAVWKDRYGIDLPAHTDASYNQLKKLGAPEVTQADARAGDVVYYMGAGTGGAITHHMGIYAGNGQVLDMSTSGGSGVRTRPIGHGGQFVILRDPRVNKEQPRQGYQAPPEIVPTGYAERSPTEPPTPRQVDAVIASAPPAAPPGRNAVNVPPALASKWQSQFGRDPSPEEWQELRSVLGVA